MLNSLNLCPGGPNDDLSADRSDTHFHTRISVFTQCACQELIQLGVENTWCSKMMLLQDDVKMWRWITMGFKTLKRNYSTQQTIFWRHAP